MSEKPKIHHRKIVAQSRLFQIEAQDIEFSNGATRKYERLMRGSASNGAVLIVPLIDNETVLLIREYSAGVERYELGLAKGKKVHDKRQTSLKRDAKREMERARKLSH